MAPTIFYEKGYRFFFFSREEERMHVHVYCGEGEAKFWLEPEIKLAKNYNLSSKRLKEIKEIIKEHYHEIRSAWRKWFEG